MSRSSDIGTLVKYESPILVSSSGSKVGSKKSVSQKLAGLFKIQLFTILVAKATSPTQDVLNTILPPREWTEGDQLWVQYVSSTPATKADVVALQTSLDNKLKQERARETGICPIREELYAQCFDELIRQITIICAERGMLLLQVRDEIRMTISAYQSLYESSIAFGMRKALQAEQRSKQQQREIDMLTETNRMLAEESERLEQEISHMQQREAQKKEAEEKKHKEEVDGLRRTVGSLREQLEQILSAPGIARK